MATKKKKTLGRSFLKGEVKLAEIHALTKEFKDAAHLFAEDMMEEDGDYDVQVVDGDLHVKGDLETFEHGLCGLIVKGNLVVDGLFAETDDPATGVFVLGNLTAARVVTNGTLGVKGTLTATEALVGFYNDYSATIKKDVVTPLFNPENHYFDIGGKLKAKVVIGYGAEYRVPKAMKKDVEKLIPKDLTSLLSADVLAGEEMNNEAFRKAVYLGTPFLAAAPKPKAKASPKAKAKASASPGSAPKRARR